MNNYRLKTSILASLLIAASFYQSWIHAQSALPAGKAQFSGGVGYSMNYFIAGDYAFHDDITFGVEYFERSIEFWAFGRLRSTTIVTATLLNCNYHFNTLFDMSDNWDYYAGLNAGYYSDVWSSFYKSSNWLPGIQMGARFYPFRYLGMHAELAVKDLPHAKIGLTIRL